MFNQSRLKKVLAKKPLTFNQLARLLNVPRSQNKEFSRFLTTLLRQGVIFQTSTKLFFIPQVLKSYEGKIRVNARGFGFIDQPEMEDSIFIAANNMHGAMDKDIVAYDMFDDPTKKGFFQGVVRKVVSRATKYFVGRVTQFGKNLGLTPHNNSISGKFRFVTEQVAEVDTEVKVEIVRYGNPSLVKIVALLGHKDDVSIDILKEIEDANVPYVFGPDVVREAKKLPQQVQASDLVKRQDLREDLIVTIDGDDTKDFDDAISVKQLANGNFLLGVHIADVAHYVTEDSALDEEAKLRGTSIYLADRVIPMLPVALSNGICSLNPHVDRLTLSCVVEIDRAGQTVSHQIFPSVINSKHRLTYQEVNRFYRDQHQFEDQALAKMLTKALELSQIMRKFKAKAGYIDFEIEESKIIIDPQTGKTTNIVPRERLESEMMIEDFMVRANETVAEHTENAHLPFIFRVHDQPDLERVQNLQGVVKILGMDVEIPTEPNPKSFAKAITQIKKTRFDDFMKLMMLRTMAKAEYSPQNIGHFGLASTAYSHFTSPIRRYPDLIAHRMLREYFFNQRPNLANHFATILPAISAHASATEQRAMELEREVADVKKAEFYEKFIGQSFSGTIVSMLKFGFFVEFPNKVDGLVHISTLIDGEYKLTNNGYSLTNGQRTFQVGDKVEATVVNTFKQEGKIDLVLSDLYAAWQSRETKLMKNYAQAQSQEV